MKPLFPPLFLVMAAFCASMAFAQSAHDEARALAGRAAELQAEGFRQEAIEHLERALGRASGDPQLAAAIRGALGQAYLRAGRLDEALRALTETLEGPGGAAVAAAALNDLGQLHAAQGRAAEAAAALRRSAQMAREAGATLIFVAAAANAALLAGDSSFLEPAAATLAGVPDSREADFARLRLAGAGVPPETAHALLDRALRSARERGDALAHSYAAGQMGQLYASHAREAEALALTREAVFAAQRIQAHESLYRWSWQAAGLLRRAGERDAALAAYRRALDSLGHVRQDLMLELRAARRSWRAAVGPLFLELADLLLARSAGETLPQAQLVEARNLVEQLKAVELEDYFQDDCVADQLARRKDIDTLEPRTAIVYPIVLPDRLEVLVGLSTGIRQVTVPVTAAALTEQAHGFRRLLEKRTTNQFMPFGRRLYGAIFAPLEPLLAEAAVDTVVFIPDGPLRGIPVAALHDGKAYLIERFAFATAPGLTLIEPRRIADAKAIQILVNGLSEAVQSFPALPHVREELSELEALFANSRMLRDREFSAAAFEGELRGRAYSIVHIASHGEFDSDPKKSFLLTYDGRLNMDGLEQAMKFARFRDDPVELLTLSACRTAAGDDRASLGLAGVAVKAGARSALATLWYVNDQASSMLVSDFYRRLDAGKARALQQAQLAIIADPRFRHPGYWAPFLLIGNWL